MYSSPVMYKFSTEDSDLAEMKWHKHSGGYANRWFGDNKVLAHRLVLSRVLGRQLTSSDITDHINRDKTDNRRENLRLANKSLNTINRDKRPDNTTGYVGVNLYWPKEHQERGWAKRWSFRVWRKGYPVYSSKYYKSPKEAYDARQQYLQVHTD